MTTLYHQTAQLQPDSQALNRSPERVAIEAQEREWERIALEVHDSIAQTLASALRYLQTLEGLSPEDWGRRAPSSSVPAP